MVWEQIGVIYGGEGGKGGNLNSSLSHGKGQTAIDRSCQAGSVDETPLIHVQKITTRKSHLTVTNTHTQGLSKDLETWSPNFFSYIFGHPIFKADHNKLKLQP